MKSLLTTLIGLAISIFAMTAQAETAQEKGLAIAEEVELRDRGWGDMSATMRMELTNKQGKVSKRALSIKSKEVPRDGDKSLTLFHEPRDVKGTAFLSFSHALEPDQQWLFLPALKRVKRISSSNKSGPFLGSELAFEDIASFEVEKFKYELLKEEKWNGEDYYVVKYIPQYKHSGYKSQEVWVHKTEYRMDKTVYFDRKGALLKTFEISDWNKYLDKFWRGNLFTVTNHQNGKQTKIFWEDYKFNQGLDDSYFNQNTLKRSR